VRLRRLFFALWPGEGVRRALVAWQREHVPASVRATHSQDLHLTLRFLGQVEEERVAELRALGEHLAMPSFQLTLDHVGHWARPAVLWTGPSDMPTELLSFQKRLEGELAPIGFQPEGRTFKPHVTLARKIRRPLSDARFEPVRWHVDEWVLAESRPGHQPLYHPIARWGAKSSFSD